MIWIVPPAGGGDFMSGSILGGQITPSVRANFSLKCPTGGRWLFF